ncbi:Protein JINGUBANG [Camellia lanceoleosa]|uniref:Protein JINGUBANG n=1 Tax=Camellia lanceoleosa TaxID=1840588 RepID=A0ACC0G7J6_9ERIC|nr:Protein JINGUBANG [Camellia lanceoleosa]
MQIGGGNEGDGSGVVKVKDESFRFSNVDTSPPNTSPQFANSWDKSSPLSKSPWPSHATQIDDYYSYTGLMGSRVRKEGHIYSLATSSDLLYTGSDNKNIRAWKNQKEFSGFKSNSGLVKAIIIANEITRAIKTEDSIMESVCEESNNSQTNEDFTHVETLYKELDQSKQLC